MRAPRARRWGAPTWWSRRATRRTWPPRCGSPPRTRVPVVAWGGGSGTQGGAVAVHGGLVIDLRALDRIIEIDERSLTVTAQAGVNGNVLERALNERGLMLPHYPASLGVGDGRRLRRRARLRRALHPLRQDRGPGALAAGRARRRRADRHRRGPAPRGRPGAHAAVRRLGGHARDHHPGDARGRPAARRAPLRHPALPDRRGGRRAPSAARSPRGYRPSVIRMYDEEATRAHASPRSSARRSTASAPSSCFEGERGGRRRPRGAAPSSSRARRARASSTLRSAERWWDRRYEFYKPPHHPELPSIWGTIDVVATYTRIDAVHEALKTAVRDRYARRTASSCGCTSRTGTAGAR